MTQSKRKWSAQGKPLHKSMLNPSEFRKMIAGSLFVHPVFALTLIIYLPMGMVLAIASIGICFAAWLVLSAGNSFDELTNNLRHRCLFLGSMLPYGLIGFLGANFRAIPLNQTVFILVSLLGGLALLLTAWSGFSAGVKLHDRFLEKRVASIDWSKGTYDLRSDSLDSVDIHAAIVESSPTWKALLWLGIVSLPGPAIGVMAGTFSSYGRYLVAIPVYWVLSMIIGYFLLRTYIDYWTVRKLEKERGVRLLVSTSLRLNSL